MLAAKGEAGAEEIEHAARTECANGVERLAFDMFGQHGSRGLADDAADTGEPSLFDDASVIDPQLGLNAIAADRIIDPVTMRGGGKRTAMIRLFEMPQYVVFVQPLFVLD